MTEKAVSTAKTPETIRGNRNPQSPKPELSRTLTSPLDQIVFLQRTIGNQAVQRLFTTGIIQPKLRIGQSNDIYEQEADRVAEQVMRMSEPQVQRQVEPEKEEEETLQAKSLANQITPLVQVQRQEEPEEEEEEKPMQTKLLPTEHPIIQRQEEEEEEEEKEEEDILQTKEASGQTQEAFPALESRINAMRVGGQALSESERAFMEPRFAYDFSNVRIYTNDRAAELARAVNARAFTIGQDIVFGGGQYSPGMRGGQRLLAHELTHTLQQKQGIRAQRHPSLGTHAKSEKKTILTKRKSVASSETVVVSPVRKLFTVPLISERNALVLTVSRNRKEGTIAEQAEGITERAEEVTWSKTSKGLTKEAKPGQCFLLMNFGINSAKLKKEHNEFLLTTYYNILNVDPMAKIKIIGHASRTGHRKFNERLAKKRARRVEKFLKKSGVRESRIEQVTGKGYNEPIADNKTAYGRARNRRVEVIVSPWKPTKPVSKLLTDIQKGMKPYVIQVENFAAAPFRNTIRKIVEEAFKSVTVVNFLWEGKSTAPEDFITFDNSFEWLKILGMRGNIFLRSFRENEICKTKGDQSTCEKQFTNTATVMGRAIANTFCHELGHALGLDHVPVVDNYMWTPALHPLSLKKNKTYEEKVLLGRKLQATPSKFNSSQMARMVHRIKEKRKMRRKRPHVIEFD